MVVRNDSPRADSVLLEGAAGEGTTAPEGREGTGVRRHALLAGAGAVLLAGLFVISRYNYVLFHGLAELFSVAVAWAVFLLVWNSRRFVANDALVFLGAAYLFVGLIDVLHTLAYRGMGIFPDAQASNLATQLWISGRLLETVSLLLFAVFLGRRLPIRGLVLGLAGVSALLLAAIFAWRVFPTCYVEGQGLTAFKTVTEYGICLTLVGTITLLVRKREYLDAAVLRLMIAAMAVSIAAEVAFTFYVSVYGLSNLVGHVLKIISFFLVYMALIRSGLTRPYATLFRELKGAQAALRESEYYYRSLIHGLHEDILVIDRDYRVTDVNDAALRTLGLARHDVIGRHCYEVSHGLDEPCHEHGIDCGLRRAFETGKPCDLHHLHLTADGERAHINLLMSPLRDEREQITHVIEAARNVTDLVDTQQALADSRERMELALRGADLGTWDWNVGTGERVCNARWARMLGYEAAEIEQHLRAWERLVHPEDKPGVEAALNAHLEGRTDSYEAEYRLRHKSGGWVWVLDKGRVIDRGVDGQALRACGTHLNISERKLAEEQLRESQARLDESNQIMSAVLDSTHIMAVLLDRDFNFVWVNRTYADACRHDQSFFPGRNHFDLYPNEENQAIFQRVVDTGEPFFLSAKPFTFMHQSERGITYWDWSLIPVKDDTARVTSLVFSLAEVTERIRAGQQLQAEQEFSSTIISETPAVICGIAPDATCTFINPAGEQTTGYERDEILGKDWWRTLHPGETYHQVEQLFRGSEHGPTRDFELTLTRKDGDQRTISWNAHHRLDDKGELCEVIGFGHDITERKRAEEDLRRSTAILNHTGAIGRIGGWEHDLITGEAVWTRALYEILEIEEGQPIPGPGEHLDYYPPEHRASLAQAYRRSMETGEPFDLELQCRTAIGRLLWIRAIGSPVFEAGKCVKMHGTFQDISDRKRAEKERAELETQLRQSQKLEALGQLAGGVAHDFNNLLTVIFGYTEVVRESLAADHAALEALAQVTTAATQATGVTRSLLTFSRKVEVEKGPVDLGNVLASSAKLLRRMLPANVEFATDLGADGPFIVHADDTQIQQVIMNLALNARDAMPEGGSLRISVARSGAPGAPGEVELVVSDTGAGMTAEVRERIFEPFFTTKAEGKGTGLGLSIIHGIVDEHDGRIELESTPDQGTTVTVVLPAGLTVEEEPGSRAPTPAPAGRGELILIAEDDHQVRRIVKTALTSLAYEVLETADGEALLEACQLHGDRVQLIVTDVDMPKRSGLDVVRHLRAAGSQMPIILITGGVDVQVEDNLDELTSLLRKPFQVAELGSLVAQMCGASPPTRRE